MEEIIEPNDTFDFSKLELIKPTLVAGGNYFIRFLNNNSSPLYIQPPKCKTKQGIVKGGKRLYSDLMFTNENQHFIRWMENLENHCQQHIFKNREKWFEGDLELHDIESYFTAPMKMYKSGKYYLVRTTIGSVLGKPTLKIYDEKENEVPMDTITDENVVMTILEIQGVKCSARSFQIEIELKQMMALKPSNLFEKCIIKPKYNGNAESEEKEEETPLESDEKEEERLPESEEKEEETEKEKEEEKEEESEENLETIEEKVPMNLHLDPMKLEEVENSDIQEVEFHLDELPENDTVQIKKRNEVYYEMYREARRKAKIARDLALSAHLEAKQIKNTYMLDDIQDSEDSDSDEKE